MSERLRGFCPMGCGETLFVGDGGYITCSLLGCPEPDAVATLLEDHETQHIVELGAVNFTIRHPLRERLRDELMDCDLYDYLSGLGGPPRLPGRYQAYQVGSEWQFRPVVAPVEHQEAATSSAEDRHQEGQR